MIKQQINDLRRLFRTDKIHNISSVNALDDIEMLTVISIIQQNKKDGDYTVNDSLIVTLSKGAVHIKDNINEPG